MKPGPGYLWKGGVLSQGSVLGALIFLASIIALPKPIYKQEFASCLLPVGDMPVLLLYSALYVLWLYSTGGCSP